MTNNFHIFFPESLTRDDTYAHRGEHTLDWLARSTTVRARECRRFLNEHLSKLQAESQYSLIHDLREKWHSTFFEVLVARVLQEMGAAIAVEQPNSDGRRPDFTAQFSETTITVEAKAPVFNAAAGEALKYRIPLLDFIETRIPEGWQVGVWQLPTIGPQESRREFEYIIENMLSIDSPNQDDEDRELVAELPSGIIYLHLRPGNASANRLIWEPSLTVFDNSVDRIAHAIKSKRRQVRNSTGPVILAIQASGISSSFEDFDRALFGHTYDRYDEHLTLIETGFKPDGAFTKKSDKPPTYAGVLAFLTVGFRGMVGPVFYRHPRFSGVLPEPLLQLEQRWYSPEFNTIQTQPENIEALVEQLHFVSV